MIKINAFKKVDEQEFANTMNSMFGCTNVIHTNELMYNPQVQKNIPQMSLPQVNQMYQEQSHDMVCYLTNNSVNPVIAKMFCHELAKHSREIIPLWFQDDKRSFIRCIAIILTHTLRLIVRHQRWIYAYNGKIYQLYDSIKNLEPTLRELSEYIPYYINAFVCSSYFVKMLAAEIEQICPEVEVPDDIGRYIVFNNCILDIFTMKPMNFTPTLFITSMVCVDWNPRAFYSPIFDKLIAGYTQGDNILASRLKEVLGVCLTNDIVKSIFCFEGITNSGKSFIVNYITGLLNPESVVSMAPDEFNGNFANVKIYDKSVCMCLDMPSSSLDAKSTSMLKQISGGDMIGAEVKYQNGNVNFRSRAHLVLGSNFDIVPAYGDMAFQARKVIIPFTHRITDENIQPDELKRMLEPEKEAIVNKLIRSYLTLRENNYVFSGTDSWYDRYIPPVVVEMDNRRSISIFISNCCEMTGNDDDFVFSEELYNAYCIYANMTNAYQYSCIESFAKDFKDAGFYVNRKRKRSETNENPRYCYTGIKLK